MSCFKPRSAVLIGKTIKGKPKYKFIKYNEQYVVKNGIYVGREYFGKEVIKVPCKECIGCRLDYSKEWANRCMKEAELYEFNYSITLTYDDEHLPFSTKILDTETGEAIPNYNVTLNPDDVTNFMKRLRERWERIHNHKNIRVFYCGEYGDQKGRPHYHLILFNFPMYDLKFLRRSQSNKNLWFSAELDKLWGKGLTSVGECNWETVAYAARYVTKKVKGPDAKAEYTNRAQYPEFVRMSRMPGIGREWYEKHKNEMYETDEMFVKNKNGVLKLKPSKYYDRLYDIEQPEIIAKIKEARKEYAQAQKEIVLSNTSMTEKEYLAMQERTMQLKGLALKRLYENGTQ